MCTINCSKCKIDKSEEEFHKNASSKTGRVSICKPCKKDIDKKYTEKSRDFTTPKEIKCKHCNIKKPLENFNKVKRSKTGYRHVCKTCYREQMYSRAELTTITTSDITCTRCNKTKSSDSFQKSRSSKTGLTTICTSCISKRNSKYVKERRLSDPLFDLTLRYRSRTSSAFVNKGWDKNTPSGKLLGTTWEGLKSHIEKQFSDGMTWDNRDLWHIDHIIPLSSAKDTKELKTLCNFKNLQPLWAEDNLSKGNKLNWVKKDT